MITVCDRLNIGRIKGGRPNGNCIAVKGGIAIICVGLAWLTTGVLPAIAANPRWSIIPSAHQTAPQGRLSGVSCPSSTGCIAVGSFINEAGKGATLGERWNGSAWSRMSTVNPSGFANASLDAVSCTSRTACEAVGTQDNGTGAMTLAEVWNGTNWLIQPTPNPTGASIRSMTSISCSTASACIAIGSVFGFGGPSAFVESWDGSAWSIQSVYGSLSGVSCTSGTACIGVGSTIDIGTGAQVTLAEAWDGSQWSVQPTPNPDGSTGAFLTAISCSSATACTAVGAASSSAGFGPLSEVWNGSAWSLTSVPSPAGQTAFLSGISCTSAIACTAVGSAGGTLAEAWDGAVWTIQSTPNPTNFVVSLNSVSCRSATDCKAVGSTGLNSKPGRYDTLAEAWNGTAWSIQPTPNRDGAILSLLFGISCPSATACTAVGGHSALRGSRGDLPGGLALAETWNGTSWSVQTTPRPKGAGTATLSGISCTSATACTAVGSASNLSTGVSATLAEMWNGTAWSIQSTPNPAGTRAQLVGVSCQPATTCIAVGSAYSSTGVQATLAERWNGTKWSILATPSLAGTDFAQLSGVSCPSATECIAVGSEHSGGTFGTTTALAESWDGTAWTIQPTPNGGVSLSGVSCTSAIACTAVGSANGMFSMVALAESWDGAVWSIESTPDLANSSLSSVSCTATSACTAVGSAPDSVTGAPAILAEAWDGATWSIQSTPALPPGASGNIAGISCTSSINCMSVGYLAYIVPVTLIERYS